MVQDSAGFQSQQFGEQVAQRRDRYAAQNIETWGQAANVVPRFQQARQAEDERTFSVQDRQFRDRQAMVQQQQFEQERQMRQAKVASDLANDQLHRQQGLEDLQWAQQLHQTDMIGLQKRGMAAEIALKEAQTRKAIDELGAGQSAKYWDLTSEEMDHMAANLGIIGRLSGNRLVMDKATDEERKSATMRKTADEQFKMDMMREERQARLDYLRAQGDVRLGQMQAEGDLRLNQMESAGRMRTEFMEEQGQIRTDYLKEKAEATGAKSGGSAIDAAREAGVVHDTIKILQDERDNLPTPSRKAPDAEIEAYTKRKNDLSRQIEDLSNKAVQMSGGTSSAKPAQPEQTVDDFLSRQSADALKILYPDGK